MGNALADQGNLEKALEAYGKALSIKPDYVDAYINMGTALRDQGKLDEAITTYKESIALKPDYAEAYNNLGNALKDKGKLEEAIDAFQKAISIKPDFAQAWNNLYFPLQAIKLQNKSDQNLKVTLSERCSLQLCQDPVEYAGL